MLNTQTQVFSFLVCGSEFFSSCQPSIYLHLIPFFDYSYFKCHEYFHEVLLTAYSSVRLRSFVLHQHKTKESSYLEAVEVYFVL